MSKEELETLLTTIRKAELTILVLKGALADEIGSYQASTYDISGDLRRLSQAIDLIKNKLGEPDEAKAHRFDPRQIRVIKRK
jgi:hypothetical protein